VHFPDIGYLKIYLLIVGPGSYDWRGCWAMDLNSWGLCWRELNIAPLLGQPNYLLFTVCCLCHISAYTSCRISDRVSIPPPRIKKWHWMPQIIMIASLWSDELEGFRWIVVACWLCG
jgi:hypothetical protein